MYEKPEKKIILLWRINSLLIFLTFALFIGLLIFLNLSYSFSIFPFNLSSEIAYCVFGIILLWRLVALIVYPWIKYKQWGYRVEKDRIALRHGIFFIRESMIPVVRIQSVTISQGIPSRILGLYHVEISLTGANFSIIGLSRETSQTISDNLNKQLQTRLEANKKELI